MKSITIHGIEDELAVRLEKEARGAGLSFNKLIKKILARALGLSKTSPDRRGDFVGFCGAWSRKESSEFKAVLREFERADPEDWR